MNQNVTLLNILMLFSLNIFFIMMLFFNKLVDKIVSKRKESSKIDKVHKKKVLLLAAIFSGAYLVGVASSNVYVASFYALGFIILCIINFFPEIVYEKAKKNVNEVE